ncbi:MBL fold metallo-hydrolase [Niabella beijingensis]|uniref:MBL fold metallo-hydrolase n=1 Tax=Niabella beijingensis TaxID=2872700 RepID=UPI001CBCB169|nr:MBL fold metallo-hydrolase [Niabella beijingensis]MBZ4189091.1 MBL fold metallo-hydrolase [Niabella beijingensis]
MKVEQIYTGCLAQGAYYISSKGEAAIIDPLREVQPYIDRAAKDGVVIRYIFETHFHADFVSGHVDLAAKTGAKIVLGPTDAHLGYDAHIARDGETFKIGDATIKVLHTPGHTLESSVYLLTDETGKDTAIFTGDTLFIGDVGRPDLAQKISGDLTKEKLAGFLFDSLRSKILPLPDELIVYPAHGAGSACGKNMSRETTDTLGHQKKVNYALNPELTREQFITAVTDGLTEPPQYFPQNVKMNIEGYESVDEVLERGNRALDPDAFEEAANHTGAIMLDTRAPQDFAKGFIPNSINIGIDGSFAVWVGTLIPDLKQEILIIADEGREEEVVTRLARVGYDYSIGYLEGGIEAWKKTGKEIDSIESITPETLAAVPDPLILDVRKESEYQAEHIDGAENVPLDYINQHIAAINRNKPVYIHCAGGYRSMIFASILKARGFDNIVDINGGFKAIKEADKFKITDFVCPTSKK